MLPVINMFSMLNSMMFGFSFCFVYIMGYFGLLLVSLLMVLFGTTICFSLTCSDLFINIIENGKNLINGVVFCDQIIISPCKQYYTFNGINYDITFPVFWVLNENPETGPHNCDNCRDYGTLRGVFIMYCANCAEYVYYNEAGYGALQNGIEKGGSDINRSAWNTYLKHREPAYIGLPQELMKMNFYVPGYTYKLTSDVDLSGNITKWYPDFVPDDEDYDYMNYDINEDDINEDDIKSDTTEELWS